jgi:hypothetical protein
LQSRPRDSNIDGDGDETDTDYKRTQEPGCGVVLQEGG